jgi:hypothetical protein
VPIEGLGMVRLTDDEYRTVLVTLVNAWAEAD